MPKDSSRSAKVKKNLSVDDAVEKMAKIFNQVAKKDQASLFAGFTKKMQRILDSGVAGGSPPADEIEEVKDESGKESRKRKEPLPMTVVPGKPAAETKKIEGPAAKRQKKEQSPEDDLISRYKTPMSPAALVVAHSAVAGSPPLTRGDSSGIIHKGYSSSDPAMLTF